MLLPLQHKENLHVLVSSRFWIAGARFLSDGCLFGMDIRRKKSVGDTFPAFWGVANLFALEKNVSEKMLVV